MSAMDFKDAATSYHEPCLSILVLHVIVVMAVVFLFRLYGDLLVDGLVAFHLLMDAVFLAAADKYLQVPSLKERTETSISKPTRNGALKPLYATSEIKPVFNNDSISTSLLRPKDRKVSPTQKKLRFSLNLEITEPSNRHFNSSTSSEVFSSEHADESDLNPSALTNTTNIDLQNSEYLPFADDEESEEPKWGSYLDTNILDDCDIDSISDEEDNPNSELQLGDIDDSEMGERPTKCALQSEPSPTEDDYDEFLSFLKKDSMQYSVVS